MIRHILTLTGLVIALSAAAAQQKPQAEAPPSDDEIVVIGRKLAMARANYSIQGTTLRICSVRSSSGDTVFDKRICVEAKECAAQGFRRPSEMTACVNRRLIIWERGRSAVRRVTAAIEAQPKAGTTAPPTEAATVVVNTMILAPGTWEVRRSDNAAPRTVCLRPGERSASILRLLYDSGQEPELNHGNCARWAFSHDGNNFDADRRCFQPAYRLNGQMRGSLGTEEATVETLESTGTSGQDLKETRINWTAKRTGNC